jgi:hypothetical protein
VVWCEYELPAVHQRRESLRAAWGRVPGGTP